jgi:CHAD domain-containing protein
MLDRPAAEGASTVARALLADAVARARGARRRGGPEALHDFRVAVRRLRSYLRAFREVLRPAVRGRDLRRLRRIARATNAARDVEVLAAWVKDATGDLEPAHRPAAAWLSGRLGALRRGQHGTEVAGSMKETERRAPRLERRLARLEAERGAEPYRAALGRELHRAIASVAAALREAAEPPDPARAHEARVEAKRLRYLLETLREVPGLEVEPAVDGLKRMQDRIGLLHDASVAADWIGAARREIRAGDAGPGDDDPRPGLLALERLARRREKELLVEVSRTWLADHGAAVLGPAVEVAAALERG